MPKTKEKARRGDGGPRDAVAGDRSVESIESAATEEASPAISSHAVSLGKWVAFLRPSLGHLLLALELRRSQVKPGFDYFAAEAHRLAKELGRTSTDVRRELRELTNFGALELVLQGHNLCPNTYRIPIPMPPPPAGVCPAVTSPGPSRNRAKAVVSRAEASAFVERYSDGTRHLKPIYAAARVDGIAEHRARTIIRAAVRAKLAHIVRRCGSKRKILVPGPKPIVKAKP
jgi:hypothetical protein